MATSHLYMGKCLVKMKCSQTHESTPVSARSRCKTSPASFSFPRAGSAVTWSSSMTAAEPDAAVGERPSHYRRRDCSLHNFENGHSKWFSNSELVAGKRNEMSSFQPSRFASLDSRPMLVQRRYKSSFSLITTS